MSANTLRRTGVEMRKYQFVVGVSLSVLEEELNRIVNDEPCLKLIQVLYAMGTGFVAVVERSEIAEDERAEKVERPKKSRQPQRSSPKKS